MYCSSAFSDGGRLVYCLVVHPLILEFVLFGLRQGGDPKYSANLKASGLLTIHEPGLFYSQTSVTFIVEAILVLNRRFMLGCVIACWFSPPTIFLSNPPPPG